MVSSCVGLAHGGIGEFLAGIDEPPIITQNGSKCGLAGS